MFASWLVLWQCITMTPAIGAAKVVKTAKSDMETSTSRTQQEEQKITTTTIAFGSCHKRKYALQRKEESTSSTIWDVIESSVTPDVFVWLGDTIYPSNRGIASLEELQWEYDQLRSNATLGYTNFTPRYGIYGIWDDHDYGGNDCGNEMIQKQQRKDLFLQFLSSSTRTTEKDTVAVPSQTYYSKLLKQSQQQQHHDGLYHSIDLDFGGDSHDDDEDDNDDNTNEEDNETTTTPKNSNRKVKLIMLDTRWFRQPHCIPSFSTSIPYLGPVISCVTRWITAGLQVFHPSTITNRNMNKGMMVFLVSFMEWVSSMVCSSTNNDLLGQDQWEWLQSELDTAHTNNDDSPQLIVIVSSIQVLTTNPVMESWGHYPMERMKLIQMLNDYLQSRNSQSGGGIILLSGDVHHAEISDVTAGTTSTDDSSSTSLHNKKKKKESFLEVTSSGLTHSCTTPFYGKACQPLLDTFATHRYAHHTKREDSVQHDNTTTTNYYYYTDLNFGSLSIDWTTSMYSVDIHDAQGQVVIHVPSRSFRYMESLSTEELEQIPSCMDGHLLPYVQKGIMILSGFVLVGLILGVHVRWTGQKQPQQYSGDTKKKKRE